MGGSGSNRTVRLTPSLHALGNATITVTATDNNNLSNNRTFEVQVVVANTAPTLNPISDVVISEDSGARTVNFSGISSGDASETQVLGVTAISSNPDLIPHPAVTYSSPNSSGSLTFTPVPNAAGTAVITVIVADGGTLNTSTSRSFTVTVNPINDPPSIAAIDDHMISESSGTAVAVLSLIHI